MKLDTILKKLADCAEFTAVKANGMTSWWDTYQPDEPEKVKQLAEEKRLAKINKKVSK